MRHMLQSILALSLVGTIASAARPADAMVATGIAAASSGSSFIASLDTMKESMDTLNNRLSPAQIAESVNLTASLNVNYVTVDTPYDYPDYALQWADAIRAAGKHVWFRMSWDAWLGIYNTPATMTPAAFEQATRSFILAHPGLFRSGDIFDICPEPEQGRYWAATYGPSWDWSPAPPNAATREYNAFVRDGSTIAAAAFQQIGVSGVFTTIRSMNPFIIEHDLEPATVSMLGRLTADSYPEGSTSDPATATALRLAELRAMEAAWPVPIILGEMGYSTAALVSDSVQEPVLKAEFAALAAVPYLTGLNYWVGAGYQAPDRYNGTVLFTGTTGAWTLRPAAYDLASFFAAELHSGAGPSAVSTPSSSPSAAPSLTASATATATQTMAAPATTAPSVTATPSATVPPAPSPTGTALPNKSPTAYVRKWYA